MSPAPGEAPAPVTALAGAELIRSLVPTLPNEPGVYRMLDERGEVLYVGKAKSLRKRVPAYAKAQGLPARLQRMVALTRAMEFVTTASEVEALLLEANLIKRLPAALQHRPARRQELPLHLPAHRPRVPADRQASRRQAAGHRVFRAVRLGRCGQRHAERAAQGVPAAQLPRQHLHHPHPALPAVPDQALLGALRRPDRRGGLRRGSSTEVREFLSGQSRRGADPAAGRDARRQRAARLRARGRPARPAQGHGAHPGAPGHQHRGGRRRRRGRRRTRGRAGLRPGVLLPRRPQLREPRLLPGAHQGRDVRRDPGGVPGPVLRRAGAGAAGAAGRAGARAGAAGRGAGGARRAQGRSSWCRSAATGGSWSRSRSTNARQALARRLADTASQEALLEQLAERFDLPETPARVEVYDNSHIQGSNAIGAFIVAGPEGFDKRSYRTFNIKGGELAAGDDYAMMREVLQRRFARLIKEDPERAGESWPELVVIDGGAGQLAAAQAVLAELGLVDLPLLAVAKGPGAQRRPGAVLPARPRAAGAGPARPGPLLCPAAARRGAPVRDPDPSRQADARHRALGARSGARASAPSASARCSTISARPAAWPRPACWTWSGCRGSIGRWRRRSMTSSTTAPEADADQHAQPADGRAGSSASRCWSACSTSTATGRAGWPA